MISQINFSTKKYIRIFLNASFSAIKWMYFSSCLCILHIKHHIGTFVASYIRSYRPKYLWAPKKCLAKTLILLFIYLRAKEFVPNVMFHFSYLVLLFLSFFIIHSNRMREAAEQTAMEAKVELTMRWVLNNQKKTVSFQKSTTLLPRKINPAHKLRISNLASENSEFTHTISLIHKGRLEKLY